MNDDDDDDGERDDDSDGDDFTCAKLETHCLFNGAAHSMANPSKSKPTR